MMWTDEKLEEAADDYAYETGWALYHSDIKDAFLAGAEYIIRQTQKETNNENSNTQFGNGQQG